MYTSSFATTFHKTNNKLLKSEAIISKQNREIDQMKIELFIYFSSRIFLFER